MASQGSDRSAPKYDRDLLLSPAKRNELIELWEVEKYGRDCSAILTTSTSTVCRRRSGGGGACAYWREPASRP
jgi:hypothetical protein